MPPVLIVVDKIADQLRIRDAEVMVWSKEGFTGLAKKLKERPDYLEKVEVVVCL